MCDYKIVSNYFGIWKDIKYQSDFSNDCTLYMCEEYRNRCIADFGTG